jgi:hypothetical protein
MVRGEGIVTILGVTPDEVFDFVLDPAQYTKADTKMIWVTKLGDTADGMVAREDGRFLNRFKGSVVTRYRWERPRRIDVTLEHGMPAHLHAWFDIDEVDGGARLHHVEELELGHGPLGWLHDLVARRWFADAVRREVAEIGRLMEAGERGRGPAAHAT